MSALLRMKIGVVGAGLACLLMSSARAQQTIESGIERAQERGSAAARGDTDGATQSSQTDRARAGQADRTRAGENRSQFNQQRQPGQRHTAGFRGAQATTSSANQEVERYIVACLLQKNQAEIEMAQLAEQQSQNPEVKKFAQMLVKDHEKIVQQLQQLQGQAGAAPQERSLTTNSRLEAQPQAGDTTRRPGSPGAGQSTANSETSTIEARPDTRDAGQGSQQSAAVAQLMEIDRQITERCVNAMKEELQQKQGAEFDMAFVGSQVGGHMQMLAALEVLGQQGPEGIRPIAQQAQSTVQGHLDHAKQLKDQLKSGTARDASQAERPQPGAARTPR